MYTFANYYTSDYNPLPLKEDLIARYSRKPRNAGFRVKVYHDDDTNHSISKDTIYNIMEKLYNDKYTHVVNMKGSIKDLCRIARLFNITIMDKRLKNYIASQMKL